MKGVAFRVETHLFAPMLESGRWWIESLSWRILLLNNNLSECNLILIGIGLLEMVPRG